MGWFIGVLTGPFSKYIMYGVGVLIVIGIVGYLWHSRVNLIEQNTKLQDQITVYKGAIAEQQKTIEQMQQIRIVQDEITKQLNDKIADQELKYNDLQKYLNSNDAHKLDRPSSEILKRTIKEISK